MSDEYEYFRNKRPDRVYLSRSLSQKQYRKNDTGEVEEFERPFRVVSKVVDCAESHQFFKDGKQVSLRITGGARQEIVAKFYEDTRGVFTLQIQRYTVESGTPHNTYFTFINEEISTLYNFLRNIDVLPLGDDQSAKLDDKFVSSLVLTREQALDLLSSQPDLVEELARTQVTAQDVAELGHRRTQLAEFSQLLSNSEHFESRRAGLGENKGPEAVWQSFFELNTWIFGYGLNYVFNAPLDGAKLERAVKGHDFVGAGIRETRALFGRPTLFAQFRAWLRRFPVYGGRVVSASASITMPGISLNARGHAGASAGPDASADARIEVLEQNVKLLNERIDHTQNEMDQKFRSHADFLKQEERTRAQDDQAIRKKLEATETGGLHISAMGVLWLFIGVTLSTAATEIAKCLS